MKDYLIIYEQAEDGAWGAHSPDVNGVFALGRTRKEVELRMAEALAAHLTLGREAGQPANVRDGEMHAMSDGPAELDGGSPLDDFLASVSDAERMLAFAMGLSDIRVQRMRADAKQTLGKALHVPSEQRAHLERAEGRGAWIIIKPDAELRRDMFGAEALSPLVRQSVVVIAAAVEAYVAARVYDALEAMLATSTVPATARTRLARDVQRRASAAPESIRDAFARIGIPLDLTTIEANDGARASDVLGELRTMRNAIVHGATAISPDVDRVRKLLDQVGRVIERLDSVVGEQLTAAHRTG